MATFTKVEVDPKIRNAARRWCRETFGPAMIKDDKFSWRNMNWYTADTIFYFRDPTWATMFSLRWVGQ